MEKLMVTSPLREKAILGAIEYLNPPKGSMGLDVGCGVGIQAKMLAEFIGEKGSVTGIDISKSFVDMAREYTNENGFADRLRFEKASMDMLPFEDNSFDWMWSVDCAGYPAKESSEMMAEFKRVVKPGGKIALLAWSSQQLLPGYAYLEAKLNASKPGVAPYTKKTTPENHMFRASGWFLDSDLKDVKTHSILSEVQAPLSDEMKAALDSMIVMRWKGAEKEVGSENWELFKALINKGASDYILDKKDYYAFFTYTMTVGEVQ